MNQLQTSNKDYAQEQVYLQFGLFIFIGVLVLYDFKAMFNAFYYDDILVGIVLGVVFLILLCIFLAIGNIYYKYKTFVVDIFQCLHINRRR